MPEISNSLRDVENWVVQIDIKGFSRGAATASVFAAWIKKSHWKDKVDINLVLFDPVHGSGLFAEGLQPAEVDVSAVEEKKGNDESTFAGGTVIIPVKSGYTMYGAGFTPQKIKGNQRLIIAYGAGSKHSFGQGQTEEDKLKYNNKTIKGMDLGRELPKGLFIVNSSDMKIIKVESWFRWTILRNKIFNGDGSILGGEDRVNKKESRDKIIDDSIQVKFFSETKGFPKPNPRS
jgi:hypothetical protein